MACSAQRGAGRGLGGHSCRRAEGAVRDARGSSNSPASPFLAAGTAARARGLGVGRSSNFTRHPPTPEPSCDARIAVPTPSPDHNGEPRSADAACRTGQAAERRLPGACILPRRHPFNGPIATDLFSSSLTATRMPAHCSASVPIAPTNSSSHFKRVVSYARPSDYAAGAATAAAGPALLTLWERVAPSYVGRGGFPPIMRLTVGVGAIAGFLTFYNRSTCTAPAPRQCQVPLLISSCRPLLRCHGKQAGD